MSADGYVKAAAAQLLSAAQAVKQDIDRLHADLTNAERQLNGDIDSKSANISAMVAEASSAPNDKARALQITIQRMQNDVDGEKRELQQKHAEIQRQIKEKEGQIARLTSKAGEIQGMAPGLR